MAAADHQQQEERVSPIRTSGRKLAAAVATPPPAPTRGDYAILGPDTPHRWASWWRSFKYPKRRQDRECFYTVLHDEGLGVAKLLSNYSSNVHIGMSFWHKLLILHSNNNYFNCFCAGEEPVDIDQFQNRKKLRQPDRIGYFKRYLSKRNAPDLKQVVAGDNIDYLHLLLQSYPYSTLADEYLRKGRVNASFMDIPLHVAAVCGHAGVMKVMLRNRFPANLQDLKGRLALDQAVHWGHEGVVRVLLDAGGTIKPGGSGDHGHWILHRTRDCAPSLVRMLVDAGAEVNCTNAAGKTPLHYACSEWGSAETVRIFLRAGAKVNIADRSDETPLHSAAESHNETIVALLLTAGANVNALRDSGENALHLACTEKSNLKLVNLLLSHGIRGNTRDFEGRTALHLATYYGNEAAVLKSLMSLGKISPDLADHNGATPLHFAACFGYINSARILIEAGADVNKKDQNNCTALHYACKFAQILQREHPPKPQKQNVIEMTCFKPEMTVANRNIDALAPLEEEDTADGNKVQEETCQEAQKEGEVNFAVPIVTAVTPLLPTTTTSAGQWFASPVAESKKLSPTDRGGGTYSSHFSGVAVTPAMSARAVNSSSARAIEIGSSRRVARTVSVQLQPQYEEEGSTTLVDYLGLVELLLLRGSEPDVTAARITLLDR